MSRICSRILALLALLCGSAVAQSSTLEQFVRQQLQNANAPGFIHVRDVKSGRVLAHVSTAPDLTADAPVPPLSVIKVYLAASWLEHGFGETVVDCDAGTSAPVRHMQVEEFLMSGCDSAGKRMAILLRQKVGATAVLNDLRRYGIRDLTLKPDASDDEWGRVLSLGEEQVPVTPARLSSFFAALASGGGKNVSAHTAQRLIAGLEETVQKGTATSIKDSLTGTGWSIGGKTGTGPGQCGDHCNGWFAGLLSDSNGGRYVVLAFIRGKGLGGGVAAQAVAAVARYMTENPVSMRP